eukprot:4111557-Alexandrium_andersonii.AAC.1
MRTARSPLGWTRSGRPGCTWGGYECAVLGLREPFWCVLESPSVRERAQWLCLHPRCLVLRKWRSVTFSLRLPPSVAACIARVGAGTAVVGAWCL